MPRKNPLGDGISKLLNGDYRWRATAGFRNDQQIRVSGVEKTKKAAQLARAAAITDYERKTLTLPQRVTLRDMGVAWLSRQISIKDGSRADYQYTLNLINQQLGNRLIMDLQRGDINRALVVFAETKMTSGMGRGRTMSSRTLNSIRRCLKAIFKEAIADSIIVLDPMLTVKPIKKLKTEHPGISLDFEEVKQFRRIGSLLHTANKLRLYPALYVALAIGLRKAEVMALRWADIDFKTHTLFVRHNLTARVGPPKLGSTKTPESTRSIALPASLVTVLETQYKAMTAEASFLGSTINKSSPVFMTVEGVFTHPDNLGKAVQSIISWSRALDSENGTENESELEQQLDRRIKGFFDMPLEQQELLKSMIIEGPMLPKISPHDLRHTAGTLMLIRGMSIERVSKVLGHRDIATTYRHYRHVLQSELLTPVVELLDADT